MANIEIKTTNDLAGMIFGNWEVIKKDKVKYGNIYWICKCSCGNEYSVRGSTLITGKSTRCRKCGAKDAGLNKRLDDFHVGVTTIIGQYKGNAKKRGIKFKLSRSVVEDIVKKNCYYCGRPPGNRVNVFNGRLDTERFILYSGIDRLDNTKDYTVDNVVPCCELCNWAKRDLNEEQFKDWIRTVYLNTNRNLTDKTPAELIDSLITVDIKCFMAQEDLMNSEEGSEKALKSAKLSQELNAKRNKLMRSIDILLDFTEDTVTPKTYGGNDVSKEA